MNVLEMMLTDLEAEAESLVFDSFSIADGHGIGMYLVTEAKARELAITVDIVLGDHQIFHYALEGTDAENDDWIRRKNNTTKYFGKNSYLVSRELASKGESIEGDYDLSEEDYAPFGGSVPIMLKDGGIAGTITVSGLLDHFDHELVVEAIKWFFEQ